MAFMSQERKKQIKAELDNILKPAKIKYSLAVRHHMTIVLNIKSSPIDFIGNYLAQRTAVAYLAEHNQTELPTHIDVNPYHYRSYFTGDVLELLQKVFAALNNGNHDRSDSQSDYFDVGWYVDVNVGKYNQPYVLTKGE